MAKRQLEYELGICIYCGDLHGPPWCPPEASARMRVKMMRQLHSMSVLEGDADKPALPVGMLDERGLRVRP